RVSQGRLVLAGGLGDHGRLLRGWQGCGACGALGGGRAGAGAGGPEPRPPPRGCPAARGG
ncbi:hypothetical protein NPS74_24970, partial [Cutibacterium acnes subsp. acnes]|nr:hypothetical protein [Cutibacterium acnes subsp. acnes]